VIFHIWLTSFLDFNLNLSLQKNPPTIKVIHAQVNVVF
jgi:hypothetical protein